MKRREWAAATLITFFTFAFGSGAGANNQTVQPPKKEIKKSVDNKIVDEKVKAAEELLDSMNMKNSYIATLNNAVDALVERDDRLKRARDKIYAFYQKYLGWDKIKSDIAKIYAKYYSVDELKKIAEFYKTPTGQKVLKVFPQITKEVKELGAKKFQQHYQEFEKLIQDALTSNSQKEQKK